MSRDYPRAIAKNGSLLAYVSAGTNLSLYLASIFSIAVTLAGRGIEWALRSWMGGRMLVAETEHLQREFHRNTSGGNSR